MSSDFATAMSRALGQIRAGAPAEATRTIQAALAGPAGTASKPSDRAAAQGPRPGAAIPEDAEIVEDRPRAPAPPRGSPRNDRPSSGRPGTKRRRLRDVVEALGRSRAGGRAQRPGSGARPAMPEGARWEARSFSSPHGTRDYRLYVPASLPDGPQGLVLMLHGCTQDPDDFARGTGMNAEAERRGLIVAYPHQTRAHNAQGCWNWFQPGNQQANRGEPAILAGLAQALAAEFGVDPARVFAAGLSAGGAMAAILGATHPDVFAAVGVHSGLACGAAHDVASAFAAMRGATGRQTSAASQAVRTIVFHGAEDPTVHLSNAKAVIKAAQAGSGGQAVEEAGRSDGGRAYTRERVTCRDGTSLTELWQVEGAGHAWSGGSRAGSYTDPDGPDASTAMVRFFLDAR